MTLSASQPAAPAAAGARVSTHESLAITAGWQAAIDPRGDDGPLSFDGLDWLAATVPGTLAGALRAAGIEPGDLDAQTCWFRTRLDIEPGGNGEELVLCFDGLATLADVFLNGEQLLASDSMFEAHAIDVSSRIHGADDLAIRFRALRPALGVARRPRARWRTRLVPDNNLRWFRTMLLGRIPSFSPRPAAVGPWRGIRLERRRVVAADALDLRTTLDGDAGVVTVSATLRAIDGPVGGPVSLEIEGPSGRHRAPLQVVRGGDSLQASGELRVPGVARWWPHTHGDPVLYQARLQIGDAVIDVGRIGFRSIAAGPPALAGHDIERDGLSLHVNGIAVFARGALWTPLDIVTLHASVDELRQALTDVAAAGMNMVRLPGFGPYEQEAFHELCDELGILVWQDLMFASMDYPFEDARFGAQASAEVERVARLLARHPSSAVLCGNSEVEQQVAMLGLDPALARIPFYDATAPAIAAEAGLDAVYVPSSPYGGALPMRPDRGVTNYYGVGGYRQPLSDARTSGVRFAAECLAFGNIPDDEALATLVPEPPGEPYTHHPRWKAGVARDAGAGWDFDDLRDHYLRVLFGVDPAELRRDDWNRYLDLSRATPGEVMAATYGEWRRAGSPCAGGLILWLRDLVPGAGYGVVDNRGRPKTAYFHLRRALAPTAVWLVDEGIGGVIAHVANDGASTLVARLRVTLYSDLEIPVGSGEVLLQLEPHSVQEHDVESIIGHFVDAAWAYRFGPPAQDAIVASLILDTPSGEELASQAFHFPAGRPLHAEPERRLGLRAAARSRDDGSVDVEIASQRLAYGVHLDVDGFVPTDDAFSVEPGGRRVITLTPRSPEARFGGGTLTALNLRGRIAVREDDTGAG